MHRIAAAAFVAVSLTHLISLIFSRQLREHWKEMLPKVADAREGLSGFAYNLGLGDTPPARSAHSYIEKAEYWAVVWGAIVMIASGILLWANNFAMKSAAEELAGYRDFGPFLRGAAGHPGDCGLALLLHYLRSRRVSSEYGLFDRQECKEGRALRGAYRDTGYGRLIYNQ